MSRTDALLLEATRKLLHDRADPQTRRGAGHWQAVAWRALEDNGMALGLR